MRPPSDFDLPTALVHFLAVELLPLWGFYGASFSAAKNVIKFDVQDSTRFGNPLVQNVVASTFLNSSLHDETLLTHEHCISQAVGKFMVTEANSSVLKGCPGCESGYLNCNHFKDQSFWTNVLWASIVLSTITAASCICAFASYGLCRESFGSGGYLLFTWEMETMLFWRVLVWAMLLYTAVAWGGVVLMPFWEYLEGGTPRKHFMQIVETLGFALITQLVCLKKLVKPPSKVHHWARSPRAEEFASVTFTRTWKNFFTQNNDTFSSLLVDALWRATIDQEDALNQLLPRKCSLDKFTELVEELQRDEGGRKFSSFHRTHLNRDEYRHEDWQELAQRSAAEG